MEPIFQLTPSRRATIFLMHRLQIMQFQLTPSRRATISFLPPSTLSLFQLTPSRRATQRSNYEILSSVISTHALTEGDNGRFDRGTILRIFQLTPSRRATGQIRSIRFFKCISTHALTEGDSYFILFNNSFQHFNSRPHGGRRTLRSIPAASLKFQLTPSRRATHFSSGIFLLR